MANNLAHIVTGTCRASYANLNQPQVGKFGGEPKYSVTLLIPKTDMTTKQKVDAACEAAKMRGVSELWKGQVPAGLQFPIYDGDGLMPKKGLPYGPEYKGHWVLRASTKQKPTVVDLNLQPILQPLEIYSGMYCRAGVTFFPFDKGGVGIGCSLDNVQKLADGEQLSGGVSPDEDFAGAPPAVAPVAPVYQQQAYQAPAATPYQAPVAQTYQQPGYQAPQAAPAYQPPAAPVAPAMSYQPPVQAQQTAYSPTPYQAPQVAPAPAYQPATAPMYQQPIDPMTGQPIAPPVYGL